MFRIEVFTDELLRRMGLNVDGMVSLSDDPISGTTISSRSDALNNFGQASVIENSVTAEESVHQMIKDTNFAGAIDFISAARDNGTLDRRRFKLIKKQILEATRSHLVRIFSVAQLNKEFWKQTPYLATTIRLARDNKLMPLDAINSLVNKVLDNYLESVSPILVNSYYRYKLKMLGNEIINFIIAFDLTDSQIARICTASSQHVENSSELVHLIHSQILRIRTK